MCRISWQYAIETLEWGAEHLCLKVFGHLLHTESVFKHWLTASVLTSDGKARHTLKD